MSRGKGIGRFSGELYPAKTCNFIVQCRIRGISFFEIARLLGRGEADDIRRQFDRICWNGSAYSNEKLYKLCDDFDKKELKILKILKEKPPLLNGPAKKYIKVQYSDIDKEDRKNAQELSSCLGISVTIIQGFIDKNNGWKKKLRPKLF